MIFTLVFLYVWAALGFLLLGTEGFNRSNHPYDYLMAAFWPILTVFFIFHTIAD